MTLHIFDGFENYVNGSGLNLDDWDDVNGIPVGGGEARFGVGAAWAAANGTVRTKTLSQNEGEIICGGAYKSSNAVGSKMGLHTFYDGTTRQCTITAETDGSIALRRGTATGTIVAQSPTSAWLGNVYSALSFRVVFSATVGQFEVYKEGVSFYTSAANLNTISSANAYCNKFTLSSPDGLGGYVYIDDFYFFGVSGTDFNTFPGDVRIYGLFPASNDSVTWTPNGQANNYQNCQAPNAVDGWYNSSATVGQIDRFNVQDMPAGWAGTILGVKQGIRAWKDDASVRQIRANLISGATTDNGPTLTMTGNATGYLSKYYKTDPATSAAWANAAAINALKMGYEEMA